MESRRGELTRYLWTGSTAPEPPICAGLSLEMGTSQSSPPQSRPETSEPERFHDKTMDQSGASSTSPPNNETKEDAVVDVADSKGKEGEEESAGGFGAYVVIRSLSRLGSLS